MLYDPDRQPLDDFRRDTGRSVARLKATGEPVFLTVDGEPELVVQDAAAYQRLVEALERAKAIEGIRQGLEDMRAGRTMPLDVAFASIRRELDLPETP